MRFHFLLFLTCVFFSNSVYPQTYKNVNAPVEQRVQDLLSRMTLDEKIDYIGGEDVFYIRAIPRLGLPRIVMSNGPAGICNFGKSTAYPTTMLLASTWNLSLANVLGQAFGKDGRARGVHILLGPGVNIYRAPMNGRNFEYLGEDPFLSGKMAATFIKGLQSQNVVGCVKHFVGNNQEWDRNGTSSNMDERTLQEIYLPAFKAAVKEGKVGSVMDSYNLVNGEHSTQNNHLNNEILKGLWGFDGLLMSDWVATYDGVAAAKAGLDLEMPTAACMNRQTLLPAIDKGLISEKIIDDKVRRILRMIFRFGFYDRPQQDKSIPLDNPRNAAVALTVAREGMVLLKNQEGLLPLSKGKIKSIAVIGPNANKNVAGGGSSITTPFHLVTTLKGIQNIVGKDVDVRYSSAETSIPELAAQSIFYTEPGSQIKGLKMDYFDNPNCAGKAVFNRIDTKADFNWKKEVEKKSGFPVEKFSVRWTGVIKPDRTGLYELFVKANSRYRLCLNDNQVIYSWRSRDEPVARLSLHLEKGKEYTVRLDLINGKADTEINFGWGYSNSEYERAINLAKAADVAVVCVGFDSQTEFEGGDRTFSLPLGQDSLIEEIAKVNPNTIVVINSGGNVNMQPWLPKVKGVLHAWYPGQEGGTAIAEILFGKVNPSGKLTASFEKRWEDNPVFNSYYSAEGSKDIYYKEGLLVGYRYYDTKKVEPQFPFGFGLSYTTFAYSGLKIIPSQINGKTEYTVSFMLKNTGTRDGAEAAQVYVGALDSKVERPEKELKGFVKVFLKAGEARQVSVKLDSSSFAYYDIHSKRFVVSKGLYEIVVGASSRDLRLKDKVNIPQDMEL